MKQITKSTLACEVQIGDYFQFQKFETFICLKAVTAIKTTGKGNLKFYYTNQFICSEGSISYNHTWNFGAIKPSSLFFGANNKNNTVRSNHAY
jgi:hypothetical protein